ncbi:PDR/VanB family oxidoreductase [Enteractinococcus coprophilus]|uniref:Ferredoxin-NADP reductase n=1 Tax=Enteractinococcus coprophilus TaxID=1027633 RepID=A0A543AN50_9MICC|nr:PDR/VanB family oxidoreductase [Enteractinococcus coprophilus]TQL74002.1 ferredoxin-NADP reductase [Enteractinococcus coprophilus]
MAMQTATRTDQLVIVDRIQRSTSVTEFVLERADGSRLPDWAPGAHIDVVLPSGKIRQYSLCGDRWTPHQYRIAVQREHDGTGGSVEIHEDVQLGDVVSFGGPRNNFRLAPAQHYRFIAGGIGITAVLPMIEQAEKLNLEWQLLYLGKTADRMAYRHLADHYPGRVTMHTSTDNGRASIRQWLGDLPEDTMVYACGPETMLEALPEECPDLPKHFLRTERFTNTLADATVSSEPYEIELYRSGKVINALGTTPVIDALSQAGVSVITSCSKGVCGTCEVDVVSGEIDHRDAILDDDERAANTCMFPCVSRALSKRLVLDL